MAMIAKVKNPYNKEEKIMVEKRFEFKKSENGECLGIHVYDNKINDDIFAMVEYNKGWEDTFDEFHILLFEEITNQLNEMYNDGYEIGCNESWEKYLELQKTHIKN